ncbi:MAG: hypothetical protein R3348_01650 [Xanthomonadales bacterium]|nr:hypothetical protein [Xanthomonadales bacterium]
MSFFVELKRRNVFRVGIAYAITAWVLIQVLDIFLPTFGAPEWVMKVVSALVLAGFPVVLIFAWAYELTPDGIKRDKDVDPKQSIAPQTGKKLNNAIIGLMAVAIAFLLYDRFSDPTGPGLASNSRVASREAEPAAAIAAPAPAVSRQSIAVLPFDNRSRDEDDAFFVEGIHDDLLTNLARIGSLKVISRTSVTKYQDTQLAIPDIAKELGVATIMEGAVQRAGDTVRINVQLIDAATDEHLWAEIFDRQMTAENLFAIQSEISEKIAGALEATLSPSERQNINAQPTENLAAYNAYLRGRQLMARRNSESVDQAAAEFNRAVELDPQFALAWVGVAETASLQMSYSDLDPLEAWQKRRAATEKALAINDQLGEAHLSKATVLENDGLVHEAEAAFQRALELSPNYATAYHWYAAFLQNYAHRRNEALGLLKQAAELDPLSSPIQDEIADTLRRLDRYEEAERQVRHLLTLDPNFAPAYQSMSDVMAAMGRHDERVRWVRKSIEMDPGRLMLNIALIWAYMDLGDTEAMMQLRQKVQASNQEHLFTALIDMLHNMYTGNTDAALETATWMHERMGRQPFFQRIIGFLHNMKRDYAATRLAFERSDPDFFSRDRWQAALRRDPAMGCLIGWVLMQTGDEELGRDLVDVTIHHVINELPKYIAHADSISIEACYLAKGDLDRALDHVETMVAHRHLEGFFFLRLHPNYEPLWGHPRFEAAMAEVDALIKEQRDNLAAQPTVNTL